MKIFLRLILLLPLLLIKGAFASIDYQITDIDSEAIKNIEITLSSLSEPKDASEGAFLSEVKKETNEALIALGYYQAKISVRVINDQEEEKKEEHEEGQEADQQEQKKSQDELENNKDVDSTDDTKEDESDQTVAISIDLGPRVIITNLSIKLEGDAKFDKHYLALLNDFIIKEQDPLNHGKYEEAKKSLVKLAHRFGYFHSHYEKATVEVTSKTSTATVFLWFDSGPRYKFGKLKFSEELDANPFVESLENFKQGDFYDANLVNEFNADINDTGYFTSSTVYPDIENVNKNLEVPMNVILTMRPEDSFSVGLGYSTDEGVRGKFRWTRPWVNKYGHSIEGNVVASIPKQEASLVYKIPLEDPLYNYLSLKTAYKLLDQNDTDTVQYIFGINRHWRLSNRWLQTIYIRYDNESGRQGAQDFATELILPGISYSRSQTMGGINATWGDKQLVFFEVANKAWFSSDDVIKTYGQTKWLRTFAGHQFVFSAELGAIQADSIYNVPASMRFFTGGDQSVRGFQYESIAPKDSHGYLVGGKYLATASFEYRMPISRNWKIATFYDLGTATDDFSEPTSAGTGLGVVWASPVGPLRVYVGIPLTESDDNFTIHFRIGPEL